MLFGHFLATGGAGRAVAGKCPKRGLKCYLGGLGASKIPYGTCFGARAAEMVNFGVPCGHGRMGVWSADRPVVTIVRLKS